MAGQLRFWYLDAYTQPIYVGSRGMTFRCGHNSPAFLQSEVSFLQGKINTRMKLPGNVFWSSVFRQDFWSSVVRPCHVEARVARVMVGRSDWTNLEGVRLKRNHMGGSLWIY